MEISRAKPALVWILASMNLLRIGGRAAATLLVVTAWAGAQEKSRPRVWIAPAEARIAPEDQAGSKTRMELWAARGEYESFQIILQNSSGGAVEPSLSPSVLTRADGATISQENIHLYRERYVSIDRGSPDRGGTNHPLGPGRYPDALIPMVEPGKSSLRPVGIPLSSAPGKNQPWWVDIFVPRTARPGAYDGRVTVNSGEAAVSVEVTLHVRNFELPLRPSLRSAFWIFDDRTKAASGAYAHDAANQQLLLEHKIMPLSVEASKEREFLDRFGLNISLLKWFDTPSYGHCNPSAAPGVAELAALKKKHQADLPLFVYLGDEVTQCANVFPSLREWSRNVHDAGLLSVLTAIPVADLRDDGSGRGRSVADIWVLLPKQYVANAADVAAERKQGGEFWVYTAAAQDSYSPKWGIDFSPANYRILGGFLAQSQGIKGLLYWAVNSWAIHSVSDPWNKLIYKENAPGIPPGEGWLVYPAEGGGFIPSMRLKWIRKSVEDYEYVELLKKAGREEWALETLRPVAQDWEHWSEDSEAIEKVRQRLGDELERIANHAGPGQTHDRNK